MSTLTPTQQPVSSTSDQNPSTTMGPADELLDPQRHELITQLLRAMKDPKINSITWACLWFADLPRIRKLIARLQDEDEDNMRSLKLLVQTADAPKRAILAWGVRSRKKQNIVQVNEDLGESCEDLEDSEVEKTPTKKRQRASGSKKPSKIPRYSGKQAEHPSATSPSATTRPETKATSLSPKKSTGRKEAPKSLCRDRDNGTCLLTRFREPIEIAHIYPVSLGNKGEEEQDMFWNTLGLFWTPEKIGAWKKQVLGPDGTQTCSNLMCLVNLAHKLWEAARFALKPLSLSEDQSVLTVQFFWLPPHSYSPQMPAIKVPSPFPRSLSSIIVDGQPSTTLFRIDTESKISSGDILTFKTDDPVGHPLPSMELLNMQWILHRVLALSGAADATDEELDPDSDMHFGLTSVYQEESEVSGEEMEEEEEEEEEEEGRDTKGVFSREGSWQDVVVEAPRPRGRRDTPTDENLRPVPRRPR